MELRGGAKHQIPTAHACALTRCDNLWAGVKTMMLATCNLHTLLAYQALAVFVKPHSIVSNLVWMHGGVTHQIPRAHACYLAHFDNVWAGVQTMMLATCNLHTLPAYQALAALV